ncbi:hypothetical protein GCM10007977_086690 [Dactylosporangium sucinum]|uniref:Uncharacterized protein n=1 Tax=Dactylosporangium sucinum TaxID=1424081 RepID=A0A917UAS5_9ACTN|nr:hypothetical protein GCM10007977_086690 [Dactylosporangium sucinum]
MLGEVAGDEPRHVDEVGALRGLSRAGMDGHTAYVAMPGTARRQDGYIGPAPGSPGRRSTAMIGA